MQKEGGIRMQAELFHDSENDALGSDIAAMGGFKRIAGQLWPSMKIESAYAKLKNSLSDTKAEKLEFCEVIQIIAWAKEHNSFASINYITDKCGFERAQAKKPEDVIADLLRAYIDSVKTQKQITDRIECISLPLREVK